MHKNERNWTGAGRVPSAPLDPPMLFHIVEAKSVRPVSNIWCGIK